MHTDCLQTAKSSELNSADLVQSSAPVNWSSCGTCVSLLPGGAQSRVCKISVWLCLNIYVIGGDFFFFLSHWKFLNHFSSEIFSLQILHPGTVLDTSFRGASLDWFARLRSSFINLFSSIQAKKWSNHKLCSYPGRNACMHTFRHTHTQNSHT